jgi:hypothetical protein
MALSGCQEQMLSDGRIVDNTAGVLGVSPSDVTIYNRRSEITNTYYNAHTRAGKTYACVLNGGGALALGLLNAPTCNLMQP